ncbi:MAG: DUF3598 family protein [Xenococcaceae cyanobacterium]
MDLKAQNWKNLCANHLKDWHGIWTRYSPQGEVIESFQSLRSFQSDLQQDEITQLNRYMYADGTSKQESWQYNLHSNSLADGLVHPSREYISGLFFASGHAALITKQFARQPFSGIEIFFRSENLRHSVGIIYDHTGNLSRTASIREDAAGFPSQYWSTELKQLSDLNLEGNWQGTSITMTPDLQVSEPITTELHFPIKGNKTFFFPDRISLSCPERVTIGNSFQIAANWLITPSQLQQITVDYDRDGAFSKLTLQMLDSN